MDETISRMDSASEQAVQSLVGCAVQTVDRRVLTCTSRYAASVGTSLWEVASVSIPLASQRFFVLESKWSDTEKERLDYFYLSARISDAPEEVGSSSSRTLVEGVSDEDQFALELGPRLQITSVDILEAHETGAYEAFIYDVGLLITRIDGVQVALIRDPDSILGGLWVTHAPEVIDELRTGLRIRSRYGG